ncbi:MAG: copper-translocating P-type ATPase [Bacteroidales bacterium]|jgi:Cu2+-exporting ATPase|nr:copper-translocating P-type ATPase [Bacteroidales bacterium]NCU34458.1 copper-translocating P-type ATPase [Candidatus Falkowbacteria bacterium]MDD3130392.1 copper-translocating P-type ATPase [Bacteroidales bacterium]MDD3525648.1 copper-translocating P-type ATPase [Bacteroidales bacterium]MDD4175489.1 copper-translocating P-type ATPase [Bacteroidales bacterium]
MDKPDNHQQHGNAKTHEHLGKHKHHEGQEHNKEHEHHDHTDHHRMMIKDFRRRFWISLVFTLPILALSPMVQDLFGFEFALFGDADKYLLFGLSSIVFFYGGWPFLTGLVDELKEKQPGMMTLIAVAITVAWGYSTATTFGLQGSSFFWELATLVDIMLLGHWIEMKSVLGASRSLQELVKLMPSEAHLLKNGNTVDVKLDELNEGDQVVVRPGEKIPVDGIITEGLSHVNESMVTGEAKPVKKEKNSKVIGGTINGNGSLTVKVEQVGENAYLNKVIKMVRDAQNVKSKTQNLADRIAFWLTIIALTIGFGTLAAWLFAGKEFAFALERMATVMVITCPHALGLAVPLVVAISTSISAQRGLLIRNRTAFENSRKITMMVFDKTGTLTKGNFGVTRLGSFMDDLNNNDILKFAGALESKSEHPLAMGIMNKVREAEIDLPQVDNFNAITGKGIEGDVKNRHIKVVSPGYLKDENIEIPDSALKNKAETVVFLLVDNKLAGYIAMSDEIRKESFDAIKTLKENDIKCYMMTGDNETVAKSVSDELQLDGYFAGLLPDQKLEKIKEFQQKGEFVAMTGDGINDAPALATADVGIAVGSGTDVAAETADIILVNSNPQDISTLVLFGKATYRKMIQNFVWATGYNVVAIPLAAGVLYSYGILISPAMGAVLMSMSTIIVAINAQFLKRKLK